MFRLNLLISFILLIIVGCDDNPMSSFPTYDFDVVMENHEIDGSDYYHLELDSDSNCNCSASEMPCGST